MKSAFLVLVSVVSGTLIYAAPAAKPQNPAPAAPVAPAPVIVVSPEAKTPDATIAQGVVQSILGNIKSIVLHKVHLSGKGSLTSKTIQPATAGQVPTVVNSIEGMENHVDIEIGATFKDALQIDFQKFLQMKGADGELPILSLGDAQTKLSVMIKSSSIQQIELDIRFVDAKSVDDGTDKVLRPIQVVVSDPKASGPLFDLKLAKMKATLDLAQFFAAQKSAGDLVDFHCDGLLLMDTGFQNFSKCDLSVQYDPKNPNDVISYSFDYEVDDAPPAKK